MTQFIVTITETRLTEVPTEAVSEEEACFIAGQMHGRDELDPDMITTVIQCVRVIHDQP